MSLESKVIKKFTYVGHHENPAKLNSGAFGNLYYLGEAWVERIEALLNRSLVSSDEFLKTRYEIMSELRFIEEALEPLLVKRMKLKIIRELPSEQHSREWRFLNSLPLQSYQIKQKALEELVSEGQVIQKRGGWIIKKVADKK